MIRVHNPEWERFAFTYVNASENDSHFGAVDRSSENT